MSIVFLGCFISFIIITLFIKRIVDIEISHAKRRKELKKKERFKAAIIKLGETIEEAYIPLYEKDIIKIEKFLEKDTEDFINLSFKHIPYEYKNNSSYMNNHISSFIDYKYKENRKGFMNRSAPDKGISEIDFFKLLDKIRDKMINKYLKL